jgi:hypothetical protein
MFFGKPENKDMGEEVEGYLMGRYSVNSKFEIYLYDCL